MIALDTNILVYAKREETSHHSRAREILKELAEGEQPWAIPLAVYFCEFV
ncbi:MAG TPA: type II toxin-antitoxin system VapC family toxin [Candidatus Binatia bacterium]